MTVKRKGFAMNIYQFKKKLEQEIIYYKISTALAPQIYANIYQWEKNCKKIHILENLLNKTEGMIEEIKYQKLLNDLKYDLY